MKIISTKATSFFKLLPIIREEEIGGRHYLRHEREADLLSILIYFDDQSKAVTFETK